jgi:hypothetical protein
LCFAKGEVTHVMGCVPCFEAQNDLLLMLQITLWLFFGTKLYL